MIPGTHFRSSKEESYSQACEEYLRFIYEQGKELGTKPDRVSTNSIAHALGVKPASVTNMVKRLASSNPPLLDYKSHRGVCLTGEGKQVALEVIRKHRLLEQFLYKIMNFSWDEVHQEALRLQYAISEAFVDRMAELLGNPSHDPHGAPIPDKQLKMPKTMDLRLSEIEVGHTVKILCIPDDDPELLRYFKKAGFFPSSSCKVLEISSHDKTMICEINKQSSQITLGFQITQSILVSKG